MADNESSLDEGIRTLTGKGADSYQPDEWNALREQHRLGVLYAGEFVVYLDRTNGEGPTLRLDRREVLFHSSRLEEAQEYFRRLATDMQRQACLAYVEPGQDPAREG